MTDTVAVWAILAVLFGHWVFDFVLQPHWMSLRKSKEWRVLGLHAWRIAIGALLVGGVIQTARFGWWWTNHWDQWPTVWFGLVNGVAHFAIDAVTSRVTSKLWREERVHDFFVVIGFDQFLHVALALATLAWFVV